VRRFPAPQIFSDPLRHRLHPRFGDRGEEIFAPTPKLGPEHQKKADPQQTEIREEAGEQFGGNGKTEAGHGSSGQVLDLSTRIVHAPASPPFC
jgi:hypothetical protein